MMVLVLPKIPTFDTNETQDVQVGGHTHVGLKKPKQTFISYVWRKFQLTYRKYTNGKNYISFMVPFNFEDTTL